jgi:hypothetical protein
MNLLVDLIEVFLVDGACSYTTLLAPKSRLTNSQFIVDCLS